MEITKNELNIMLHTLGLTDPCQEESYRNFFTAGPKHTDTPAILKLIDKGLMKEVKSPSFLREGDQTFVVTEKGILIAREQRPRPPKLTRGQRRYRNYLDWTDIDMDLTFHKFLTHPFYAEYR
jgi:hypothetical protein